MDAAGPTSSELKRLRTIELWVGAALLLLALGAVIGVGALLSQVVFASDPPVAEVRRAAPPALATSARSGELAPPTAPPSTDVAPVKSAADSAAAVTAATATASAPSAASTSSPSSPRESIAPPDERATAAQAPRPLPTGTTPAAAPPAAARPPSSTPTTAPTTAPAPAPPSNAELARRRCVALDSYIAELRARGAGAAEWVGEQLQTALGRRTELGC
jgi:hypothetical protein